MFFRGQNFCAFDRGGKQFVQSRVAILLTACFLYSPLGRTAACCGGGFATPSLIAGDDRAQLTSSLFHSQLSADVYTNGLWRKREAPETNETFRVEGAHIFRDRFQIGGSLPVITRKRGDESSSGLGDVNISVGYEYLPDWNYNPWRPKGLGYMQLTIPTGRSIFESAEGYGLDSRGRGLWAIGAGTFLSKTVRHLDVFSSLEAHRAFSKRIERADGRAKPGWGGNLSTGLGYNFDIFRIGSSLAWSYEDAVDFVADNPLLSSDGGLQRYATGTLLASYLANDDWAATASYSDQTLFGSPVNTSLSKTVMLQLQRRWGR